MNANIQEFYRQYVRPMSEAERLKLAWLIINEIAAKSVDNGGAEYRPTKAFRYIYENLPNAIQIPAELRGRKAEVVFLLLDDENEAEMPTNDETADSHEREK